MEVSDIALREPPDFDWDPWTIENIVNPYPMHHAMRQTAPVVWLPQYKTYAVARHAECTDVLTDYKRFTSTGGVNLQDIRKPGNFRAPSGVSEIDPPGHTPIRAVLNRLFDPRAMRQMRETFDEHAGQIVDDVLSRGGRVEAIGELIEPYVVSSFSKTAGVRLDRTALAAIADWRFNQSCAHNELFHEAAKRAQPYIAWYDQSCQRQNVEPGSIADRLFDFEEAGDLPPGKATELARTLVAAGVDTTMSAIHHTLHQLALHPDVYETCRANPDRLRDAFDEGMRLETTVQWIWRTTTRNVELSGYRLADDTKVAVLPGAANRDPLAWKDPEKFDISRESGKRHLALGTGVHVCIGQMVARHEADALLRAIVKRVKSVQIAGKVEIRPVNQMRFLKALPLDFISA